MRRTHFITVLWPVLTVFISYSYAQQCRLNEFRCSDGRTCLTTEKLCNNIEDCPSGEDETGNENYDCTKISLGDRCSSNEFKCRFGGCVPRDKVCDSVADCWGGTDEAIEICSRRPGYRPPGASAPPSRPAAIPAPQPPARPTTAPYVPPSRPAPTTTRRPPPPPPSTTQRAVTTRAPAPPPAPAAGSRNTCPKLEIDEGQSVICFHQETGQIIECTENPSPVGTTAKISCMKYWKPPPIGSITTEKTCDASGKWVGGNKRFRCDLECGEGGFPPKAFIAGGRQSIKGKWPWNVGLYERDPPGSNNFVHICGATLISPRAVITAAHCVTYHQTVEAKNTRDLYVFLGKFNRTAGNNDGTVQGRKVIKIDVHPDYNTANLESDISLLWLGKDAKITPFVHPICLPNQDFEVEVGDKGTLAGWGSIGDRVYPEELREAELPVVSSNTCRESHRALQNLVRQTTFCAGHKNGTSACDGDSGGGLVFHQRGKWVIQGIVSGGVPKEGGQGCDPKHYVAFTKVVKYRQWVDTRLDSFGRRRR